MSDKPEKPVFADGKAEWLLKHADQLNEDERALLLAITELEKETGRKLTDEERAALEKLSAASSGFDAASIRDAVQKMVESSTRKPKIEDWPSDLGRKFNRSKK